MSSVNAEATPESTVDAIRRINDVGHSLPTKSMGPPIIPCHSPLPCTNAAQPHLLQNSLLPSISYYSIGHLHASRTLLPRRDNGYVSSLKSRQSSGLLSVDPKVRLATALEGDRAQPKHSLWKANKEMVLSTSMRKLCEPRLRISFGTISETSHGKLSIQNVTLPLFEYPCLLSELDTPSKLVTIQKEHFPLTCSHYGLEVLDFVGAATASFVSTAGRYVNLRLSFTEADWNQEIEIITNKYQIQCHSQERGEYNSPMTPTKVLILFDKVQFDNAMVKKKINLKSGLIFLEAFDEKRARTLMENDFDGFLRYNRMCEAARMMA